MFKTRALPVIISVKDSRRDILIVPEVRDCLPRRFPASAGKGGII
jgi:hypothetical protein